MQIQRIQYSSFILKRSSCYAFSNYLGRKLSPNPHKYLTVEFIASRMLVDLFMLQHWMEKDAAFKEGLEIVKRTYETDLWPDEDKTDAMGIAELAFGITLVLEETKTRYTT